MLHFHVEDDNPWVGLNKKVLLTQGTIENVVKKLIKFRKAAPLSLTMHKTFQKGKHNALSLF